MIYISFGTDLGSALASEDISYIVEKIQHIRLFLKTTTVESLQNRFSG
jgi:hypothetical protein